MMVLTLSLRWIWIVLGKRLSCRVKLMLHHPLRTLPPRFFTKLGKMCHAAVQGLKVELRTRNALARETEIVAATGAQALARTTSSKLTLNRVDASTGRRFDPSSPSSKPSSFDAASQGATWTDGNPAEAFRHDYEPRDRDL